MQIDDLWPTLRPVYDQIKAHFSEKNKQPFFLLAGQLSGKTVLANVLMEEYHTAGKRVFITAATLNQAAANTEIYTANNTNKRSIEYVACVPRSGENLEKRLEHVCADDLLVVEDYEWLAYAKVDRIIDICLAKVADVLILSSQGLYTEGKKYTPTVKYSTWELNPIMNESNYLFLKSYATFERDYGGGKPYPY